VSGPRGRRRLRLSALRRGAASAAAAAVGSRPDAICSAQSAAKLAGEEPMMINGIMVLVLAIVVLAILWAIVLYGSTYFGPRTD
jgi:hypothetical protein